MTDEQISTRADAFEKERAAFEENYRRVLDLTITEDAWGRPKYVHSHVDALFSGWMARASLVEVDLSTVTILSAEEVGKIREALEWSLDLAQAQHVAKTYGLCGEALRILTTTKG